MADCRANLTTRSDRLTLDPWSSTTGDPEFKHLIQAEADRATWRIVELWSNDHVPFEVELKWAAGAGSGATVKITVNRATRVSIFARWMAIRAANISNVSNTVGCTIADGQHGRTNVYVVRGEREGEGTDEVEIPPFAERALLELADPAQLPSSAVWLYDGNDQLRAMWAGDEQGTKGVPLGDAKSMEVQVGSGVGSLYRVTFFLIL